MENIDIVKDDEFVNIGVDLRSRILLTGLGKNISESTSFMCSILGVKYFGALLGQCCHLVRAYWR